MTSVLEVVESRRSAVVRLTREGMSASQIAAQLGICERTVQRYRRVAGISQGASGVPMTAEELELARRLIEDGCSRCEVARTVGRHANTIARYFPESGWTREQVNEYTALLRRLKVRTDRWQGVFIK